ncbi:MAG: hypothetical protein KAS32_20225 [Candidatus Peribacteraceae bacterium]|nr:hypothetical protein [Candidatus Peribacteraceae bacterium]
MKKITLALMILSLSGCVAMVRPQVMNESQIVISHGAGWYQQAQASADQHCWGYGKRANMHSTNCGLPAIHGGVECMTIYYCD